MSEAIDQQVFAIIAKRCGPECPPIEPTFNLKDAGIDSLTAIEIIFDIEEHFDIELPERDPAFDTNSVQGLLDAVNSALSAKAVGAPPAP